MGLCAGLTWDYVGTSVIGAHFHMINTLDGHPFEQIGQVPQLQTPGPPTDTTLHSRALGR
eukprot:3723397-Rhodomonas_salina.3